MENEVLKMKLGGVDVTALSDQIVRSLRASLGGTDDSATPPADAAVLAALSMLRKLITAVATNEAPPPLPPLPSTHVPPSCAHTVCVAATPGRPVDAVAVWKPSLRGESNRRWVSTFWVYRSVWPLDRSLVDGVQDEPLADDALTAAAASTHTDDDPPVDVHDVRSIPSRMPATFPAPPFRPTCTPPPPAMLPLASTALGLRPICSAQCRRSLARRNLTWA